MEEFSPSGWNLSMAPRCIPIFQGYLPVIRAARLGEHFGVVYDWVRRTPARENSFKYFMKRRLYIIRSQPPGLV